jgi:hypothetical protein
LNFLTSFDKVLFCVFGCPIGPRSFEGPNGDLTSCQTSLLISLKGFDIIFIVVNTLTTFLKSSMLVASSLASCFLVD